VDTEKDWASLTAMRLEFRKGIGGLEGENASVIWTQGWFEMATLLRQQNRPHLKP